MNHQPCLLWASLSCGLLVIFAGDARAQSPIGGEIRLFSGEAFQDHPRFAFYPDGSFVAGFEVFDDIGFSVWARRYSSLGNPLTSELLVRQGVNAGNASIAVFLAKPVPAQDGGFWIAWYEERRDSVGNFVRRYTLAGDALGEPFRLGEPRRFVLRYVRAFGEDRLVGLGEQLGPNLELPLFISAAEYDGSTGTLLREFRPAVEPERNQNPLSLFVTSPDELSIGWASCRAITGHCDLFEQRFSGDGAPLRPRLLFNRRPTPESRSFAASVALDAAGDSVAVWEASELNGAFQDVIAQRASAGGRKVGRPFVVPKIRESAQRFPSVAADRFGNFVVFWQSFDPTQGQFLGWHVRGQLFRKDGTRVGREIVIEEPFSQNDEWQPTAVFGPNGTFLVHYVKTGPVVFRRYSASPADEPCVWAGGSQVKCDTGRTGGEAELPLALRLFPGDVPLFGDVDGDGRADPCLRRGRTFLCDADHEGGTMERSVRFGRAEETSLMGDVNGDGKAEACVRSGRQFLCDTRHDGGHAEWFVAFGQPADVPLLGDLDGDRRDDPCVFRSGRFLCDTAHDGATAELVIDFGRGRDQPVVGDFDGDGRDDPCVLRSGRFLCDTAHDGGAAELELTFGRAGDRPLLANLDGL